MFVIIIIIIQEYGIRQSKLIKAIFKYQQKPFMWLNTKVVAIGTEMSEVVDVSLF